MNKYSMENIELIHGGSTSDIKNRIIEIPTVPITKKEETIKNPEETANVTVNHPNHYNKGKIEVIEYIEDQNLGFCLGNAIKYISRAGSKQDFEGQDQITKTVEDLRKAIWYIERRIIEIEKDLYS